ncbi:hypothetical protein GH714_011276 [Hevea brasiliensis]|uniref:Uncharacterized protein n=1 Tax=Hevea brasiliensis TaxID=3981 RepID=A0A6A6MTA4_HEVBR|nr:hypothetical protein GH714_011276 [Hevea brasiliensis]
MDRLSSTKPTAYGTSSLFSAPPTVASPITMVRFPSIGPSTNQIKPPLAATVIPDNPWAAVVTSFSPLGYYLGPVATSEELAQYVLPYPLSDSYEILLGK